jgi:signal transduction histidine kinase
MQFAGQSSGSRDVFQGGGELGVLMRAHNWAGTRLGNPDRWPRSLQSIIRMMLTSRYQMWMAWGPELTFFFNDAYRPTLGVKFPWAIGQPAKAVWAEIWPEIGPLIEHVLSTGEATYSEGMLLVLERSGFPEETYHTFSYSPLFDDDGTIAGLFCVVVEETERVIGERRLGTLRELASSAGVTRSETGLLDAVGCQLSRNLSDLPFTLVYLLDESRATARLSAHSGIEAGHPAAPCDLGVDHGPWPLRSWIEQPAATFMDLAPDRFGALPTGAWNAPPTQALMVPITQQGHDTAVAGFLIVGLNPYRKPDQSYAGFVELLAGQISAALAAARAYEAERKRAEALAEIDRAKTAFFSNVSHEFRTPLTLMLGPLEEILATSSPADGQAIRSQIELAHRNGTRLLRLVNSLLDFSRIEAGRVQGAFVPTDLGAYSAEIASSFRSATEAAGLGLHIRTRPVPGVVYLDREMWEKVLLNLLSNAFKFTFEGAISVEIGPSADGKSAEVRVSDTGIGVAEDQLPRLFERFHRVEGARGRTFEGSGIGLALVQELVRLHGGSISVESRVGQGTTFTISLLLGSSHLPAGRVHAEPQTEMRGGAEAFVEEALRWLPQPRDVVPEGGVVLPSAADASASGRSDPLGSILLADDNADMRDYVRRLLRDQGYRVAAVGDGLSALAAVRSDPPDLILSDVMMPGLDGFELLRAIRADEALARIPVILLSARAGEEAKVEGLGAGADDYLIKPFAARELLARVAANIQMARMRRETEEKLQALNAGLEDRVTQEVKERLKAEEALRQAQKMEAVGQLTGGVAHDFNNLLTVIVGGLDTIKRNTSGDNPRVTRSIEMAMQGAQRASSLTTRLLAFSRRQPLQPKPLDLNAVVRDSSELLHRTLGETIELEVVLTPRLWTVEADQNQLESAIVNLAVNARDAMPDGGKLTVETGNAMLDESYAAVDAEVIPGQYAVISVSDNGFGMSKATLARVFEPFYTTKEVGKGTGLGLSMVYGFVKQSGGHVTIYSEEGEGTTVKLYFPRYRGEAALAAKQVEAGVPRGQKEVVLVVEDHEDVRNYSVMVLEELGYAVLEAADAESALNILRGPDHVDLLFTDVVLPRKTGRVLADEAIRLRPGLRVLFTTGYSRNAIVHQGRLDAGVELLTKPFTLEQLGTRIRTILDR